MGFVWESGRLVRVVVQSQFARNVGTTLGAQGVSLVFSLLSAGLIARFLGPAGKGTVALALAVPGVLGLLLNGGIGLATVYLVGSRKLTLREASRACVTFTMLACVAGAAVTGVINTSGWLRSIVPGVPAAAQMLAMILFPLNVLDGYLTTLLMAVQRISALNIITSIVAALNTLGIALFVGSWQWGNMGAIGASILGILTSALLKGMLLTGMGASFRPSWSPSTMRCMIGFGMKGQIGSILQFFNYRLDMFVLNYFRGPGAVGIYGAAVAMAELLWQLPNAVGLVIFPKAAASHPDTLSTFTPKVLRATLALTATGGIALALGGPTFIEWVYSSAFADAYEPLLALLPGVVLLGGFKVLANEMAGRGYPHYNSLTSGTVLLVTVTLDLLLIPRWGALGAAVASSVAYAGSFLLSLVLYGSVVRKVALAQLQGSKAVSSAS